MYRLLNKVYCWTNNSLLIKKIPKISFFLIFIFFIELQVHLQQFYITTTTTTNATSQVRIFIYSHSGLHLA